MSLKMQSREAYDKRLNEWENWLTVFMDENSSSEEAGSFKYITNAAFLLNDLYWRLIEQYVRPILLTDTTSEAEHLIHPYKIISASEIAIMMTEPVEVTDNPEEQKLMNATLAWFVAMQMIEGWKTGSPTKIKKEHIEKVAGYKEYISPDERYPKSFAAEHITWLVNLNVTIEKPVFLGAQCWRLFFLACEAVANKGDLN